MVYKEQRRIRAPPADLNIRRELRGPRAIMTTRPNRKAPGALSASNCSICLVTLILVVSQHLWELPQLLFLLRHQPLVNEGGATQIRTSRLWCSHSVEEVPIKHTNKKTTAQNAAAAQPPGCLGSLLPPTASENQQGKLTFPCRV